METAMEIGSNRGSFRPKTSSASFSVALFATVTLAAALVAQAMPARQIDARHPTEEVVATLSAGHVVWCVTKDSILVAAVGGGGEQGSHLPSIVPIGSFRIAVLLGAVDWAQGSAGKTVRLDSEIPQAIAKAIRRPTQGQPDPNSPSEIEQVGVGMLELLRPLVGDLHHNLNLAPDEPLVELLLADYVENYGPEIWSLRYRIHQENLGNDFWDTRIERPAFYQLYPPEKGSARTFIESQYPPDLPQIGMAARLAQDDPTVARIRDASTEADQALRAINDGHSDKAAGPPVADFLRGVLPALVGDQSGLVLGEIDAKRGFQWILPPAEMPPPPSRTDAKPVEPGAPTLRKYIPPQN
jgi:hypothetical protein